MSKYVRHIKNRLSKDLRFATPKNAFGSAIETACVFGSTEMMPMSIEQTVQRCICAKFFLLVLHHSGFVV